MTAQEEGNTSYSGLSTVHLGGISLQLDKVVCFIAIKIWIYGFFVVRPSFLLSSYAKFHIYFAS